MKLELEFEFEINDWIAFQKDYLKNSKQFKRAKLIVSAMMPSAFGIVTILDLFNNSFNMNLFLFYLVLSILWVFFYPKRFENQSIRRSLKMFKEGDNSGILGKNKLIMNDDGLKLISPETEQSTNWSGIKKFVETEDYFFLYNSTLSAIIIPKNKVNDKLDKLKEMLNYELS